MTNIVRLLQDSEKVFTEALEAAQGDEVEHALVVMMRKDGIIRSLWTKDLNSVTALGLIAMLNNEVVKALNQ